MTANTARRSTGTSSVRGITGRLLALATFGDDQALVDPATPRPTLSVLVSERSGCPTSPVEQCSGR